MKKILIAVVVLVLAGIVGVCLQPTARPWVRAQIWRQTALKFERDWECVDVIGIRELPGIMGMADQVVWVVELSRAGGDSCWEGSGEAFTAIDHKAISKLLGYEYGYHWACIRMDDWGFGLCQTYTFAVVRYPQTYQMWPGRGE